MIDFGVKTLKLTTSNYKKWNDVQSTDMDQLEITIEDVSQSPLRADWNKLKLVTELMLLEGFPLDSEQEDFTLGKNELVRIESVMVPNKLIICLDEEIEENLIEELHLDDKTTFICLDSAISNQNKLRLSDRGMIKTV